jgi:hypothetical protein
VLFDLFYPAFRIAVAVERAEIGHLGIDAVLLFDLRVLVEDF